MIRTGAGVVANLLLFFLFRTVHFCSVTASLHTWLCHGGSIWLIASTALTLAVLVWYNIVYVGGDKMEQKILPKELPTCSECHRLHAPDQPCPLRIANAYTMQVRALDVLTYADKCWIHSHVNFSVLGVVEQAIVEQI